MTATAEALAWGLRAIAVACLIDFTILAVAVFIVRRRRRRRWTVRPVVAGKSGTVSRIGFATAIFAEPITPGQLRAKIGDPFEDES